MAINFQIICFKNFKSLRIYNIIAILWICYKIINSLYDWVVENIYIYIFLQNIHKIHIDEFLILFEK